MRVSVRKRTPKSSANAAQSIGVGGVVDGSGGCDTATSELVAARGGSDEGARKVAPQCQTGCVVQVTPMERIYLDVRPEDYAGVEAAGASWDGDSKRWYIQRDAASDRFSRWLGEGEEAAFGIASDEAFVASARTACVKCHDEIEVICIYCDSGTDVEMGEPIARFTVDCTRNQRMCFSAFRRRSRARSH